MMPPRWPHRAGGGDMRQETLTALDGAIMSALCIPGEKAVTDPKRPAAVNSTWPSARSVVIQPPWPVKATWCGIGGIGLRDSPPLRSSH